MTMTIVAIDPDSYLAQVFVLDEDARYRLFIPVGLFSEFIPLPQNARGFGFEFAEESF